MERRLTQSQVDELAYLREEGWTHGMLARKFGVSLGCVAYQCRRQGAIPPKGPGKSHPTFARTGLNKAGSRGMSEDDIIYLKRLLSGGLNLKTSEMSRMLDRPYTTVRYWVQRLAVLEEAEDMRADDR